MQIIFSCSDTPFDYATALGIVGAALKGLFRRNGGESRNPREWLCHSRYEFTDGKLAKARRREFAKQTREVSEANGERPKSLTSNTLQKTLQAYQKESHCFFRRHINRCDLRRE